MTDVRFGRFQPERVVGRAVGRLFFLSPVGPAAAGFPERPARLVKQRIDPPLPSEPLGLRATASRALRHGGPMVAAFPRASPSLTGQARLYTLEDQLATGPVAMMARMFSGDRNAAGEIVPAFIWAKPSMAF